MNPPDEAAASADAGRLPRELQSFEAALARLRPSGAAIDRDRLMFVAGQESVRREVQAARGPVLPGWFWPASTVAMTGAAATLLFLLVTRASVTGEGPSRVVSQSATSANVSAAAAALPRQEQAHGVFDASSLAWRKRITDELLSSDSLAQARTDLPVDPPADADEETLSSRSYKQLLDEAGNFRRLPRTSHSPKSSS